METGLSRVALQGPETEVSEQMVFFPMDTVDGKWVTAGGKLIAPAGVSQLSELKRVLMVQHGLPGDAWRRNLEAKARKLAQETGDASVLFLVPGGIRTGSYDLDISSEGPGSELAACTTLRPFFFDQPFSFPRYTRTLFAAMKALRRYVEPQSLHIAGHSYGALAVLYALRQCERSGVPLPQSANFLAPFVQVALDTQDADTALNIVNTRVSVEGTVGAGGGEHIRILRDLLDQLKRQYNLTEPQRNPIDWHRQTFGQRFFGAIGDLSQVVKDRSRVRVFRGERDPYIGEGHADLVARRVGQTRETLETVLSGDEHGLESLDLKDLLAA